MPSGDDYRAVIADYLVGRRAVPLDELERACRDARDDAAYSRRLFEELGFEPGWIDECRRLRARVAELAELPASEQALEFPDLVAHARRCAACRRAVWEVRSVWEPAPFPEAGVAWTAGRILAAAIHVVLGPGGDLTDAGLGPPPVTLRVQAATIGPSVAPDADDDPWRREWALRDDDAAWSVRLTLRSAPSRGQSVSCALESVGDNPDMFEGARIEIYAEADRSLVFARDLPGLVSDAIPVMPGRWRIRLVASNAAGRASWEIPLVIEAPE